jgi:hypothetical protein
MVDLTARAQRVWIELAGAPVAFPAAGLAVVTSGESLLCPPGWAGIVVLGPSGIATVPGDDLIPALADLPADLHRLPARFAPAPTLGPATLSYLDRRDFRPAATAAVEENADIAQLVADVGPDDAGEAGLDEITSPVFVLREGAEVVAAAGYRRWPGEAAHLSVLTGTRHRNRGLAGLVASAATAHALDHGLLPQWRARPLPSRRVAHRLGFRELGAQLSVDLRSLRPEPATGEAAAGSPA